MKSKTTAAVLALLLGGLGIHKFYLGNSIGILYLLFCWTLIPALVGFIEALLLFSMSEKEFNLKYNREYLPVTYAPVAPVQNTNINVSAELEKFHELKEKGIITNEEFEHRKKILLNK